MNKALEWLPMSLNAFEMPLNDQAYEFFFEFEW